MINLIIPLLLSTLAMAQKSSPVLDPNKYTVCAITINSDDEKKIFQDQAAKFPKKFNPVVELTDFSHDENWFDKACESKVKCDQLIISGHFGGDFFGSSGKSLPMSKLEKAGCSNSCPGIMNQPHEVFLFGCNTLAEKDQDHRTPAQYLQVLLADGIPRDQAELVVESRYGNIGDSNRAVMQRAFGGSHKQIYGFSSVGPSGKNVKQYLQNYFAKTNASDRLDKLSGMRMLKQVNTTNSMLAQSLKATAFAQCESSDLKDESTKKICSLQDSRVGIDKKIEVIVDALQSPNFLSYIPAINIFLTEFPVSGMSASQKKALKEISDNKIVTSQILGLINKTTSLSLLKLWSNLAKNLGMMEENDIAPLFKTRIKNLLSKPISEADAMQVCDVDSDLLARLDIQRSDIKNKAISKLDIMTMGCLKSTDPVIYQEMARFMKTTSDLSTIAFLMNTLIEHKEIKIPLSAVDIEKFKKLFNSPTDEEGWIKSLALQFFALHAPKDPTFRAELKKALSEPDPGKRYSSKMAFSNLPTLTKEEEIFLIDQVSQYPSYLYIPDIPQKIKSMNPDSKSLLEDSLLNLKDPQNLFSTLNENGIKLDGLNNKILAKNDFSAIEKFNVKDEKILLKFTDNLENRTVDYLRINDIKSPEITEKMISQLGQVKLTKSISTYLYSTGKLDDQLLLKAIKTLNPKGEENVYFFVNFENSSKSAALQMGLVDFIKTSTDMQKLVAISTLSNMKPSDPKVLKAIKEAGIILPPPK